jgi:hypothetical protein
LTRSAVSQERLQRANDLTGRTLLKDWHGTPIRQGIPSQRINGAADHQTSALLEVLYGGLNLRPKYPVNRKAEVRSTAQGTLQASYGSARGAQRDCWLPWIRHDYPFFNRLINAAC